MTWKRAARGIAVAVAACIPACGTAVTKINSRVEALNAPPVKRLVVLEHVESPDFGHEMHIAFSAALMHRLALCGVAARVIQYAADDVVPTAPFAADVEDFHADTVLLIEAAGGSSVVHKGYYSSTLNTEHSLIFDFRLVDRASSGVRWRAKSQLDFRTGTVWLDDTNSGVRFGTSIIARLRDDHILAGCPAAAAGWPDIKPRPGCMQERQRVVAEASKESDLIARMRVMSSAPICE